MEKINTIIFHHEYKDYLKLDSLINSKKIIYFLYDKFQKNK